MLSKTTHSFSCTDALCLCVCLLLSLTYPFCSAPSPALSPTLRAQLRHLFSTKIVHSTSYNQSLAPLNMRRVFKFLVAFVTWSLMGLYKEDKTIYWHSTPRKENMYFIIHAVQCVWDCRAQGLLLANSVLPAAPSSGNKGSCSLQGLATGWIGASTSPQMTSLLAI